MCVCVCVCVCVCKNGLAIKSVQFAKPTHGNNKRNRKQILFNGSFVFKWHDAFRFVSILDLNAV